MTLSAFLGFAGFALEREDIEERGKQWRGPSMS